MNDIEILCACLLCTICGTVVGAWITTKIYNLFNKAWRDDNDEYRSY